MKNTRTQRSAAELIAASQLQLQNRILLADKKDAMADPAFEGTVSEIEALKVTVREAKKILGDGPQSSAKRIEKHQVWIDRIQDEAGKATDTLAGAELELAARARVGISSPALC